MKAKKIMERPYLGLKHHLVGGGVLISVPIFYRFSLININLLHQYNNRFLYFVCYTAPVDTFASTITLLYRLFIKIQTFKVAKNRKMWKNQLFALSAVFSDFFYLVVSFGSTYIRYILVKLYQTINATQNDIMDIILSAKLSCCILRDFSRNPSSKRHQKTKFGFIDLILHFCTFSTLNFRKIDM